MVNDPDYEYDISETDMKKALAKFGVPKDDRNKTMLLRVIRLITTDKFYSKKEDLDGIPSYGFRNNDIYTTLDAHREQTRRQTGLKRLEKYGIVDRVEPKPQSSKFYWYVTNEFREMIRDAPFDDSMPKPEPLEDTTKEIDLPYHDETLEVAPGNHAQIMVRCLEKIVPTITEEPKIIHSDIGSGATRENVRDGKQHLIIKGNEYRFRLYPDILILDEKDDTLLFFESVVSTNPFTDNRIESMLEPFKQGRLDKIGNVNPDFDFVFITLFPDVQTYRQHLTDIGDRTYVWISERENELRGHKMDKIPKRADPNMNFDLNYSL